MTAVAPRGSPSARQAPNADPDQSHRRALLIGALVGLLGVCSLGLLGVAALMFWLWQDSGPPPATDAPPASASVEATTAQSSSDDSVRVRVRSEDGTIRWLRLQGLDGTTALRGRPDIDGAAPAGSYRLEAKVAGRPTTGASIDIDGDVDIACTPNKFGVVRCETDSGPDIELKP